MIPLRDDNPTHRKPVVTVALIALNLVLFVYELSLGERVGPFLQEAAFVPSRAFDGGLAGAGSESLSILLSMFLHGGWMHFLGNMLFLWIFGDNIEDRLGHLRFVVFYLGAGYAAALAHAFAGPESMLPAIGASGAISGILGAYLLLHPKAPIQTLVFLGFFVTTIRVPALVYLPLWFILQLFSGITEISNRAGGEVGGVAWWAHIGGFVAGPVLLFLLGGFKKGGPGEPRPRPAVLEGGRGRYRR
ncbi:MAG TPA: rhomboid family intramembrane serine protease [Thermoanaerobaculia bacterium]|nr:rhomboid family intramembrane serine protease [Thermoanaerobaculia bacterium]